MGVLAWFEKKHQQHAGVLTAATLGTLGALGSLLPGGAKPSEIPKIYSNAYLLGRDGSFIRNDGVTQSGWADLGPHIGDGMSNILPKTGEWIGKQAGDTVRFTLDGLLDGLDLPELPDLDDLGNKILIGGGLVLGAILLSRS